MQVRACRVSSRLNQSSASRSRAKSAELREAVSRRLDRQPIAAEDDLQRLAECERSFRQ